MAAVIDRMNELERRWIDPKLDREIVPHGFRSSFRDWAAEHGYDDPVAEAASASLSRAGWRAAFATVLNCFERIAHIPSYHDAILTQPQRIRPPAGRNAFSSR